MMPGLTRMTKVHMVKFTKFDLITPVAVAARALEDFYAGIAKNAGSVWAPYPWMNQFAVEEGNFRLNFKCVGDTIPWTFVKGVAERLWEAACLGATDIFEAIYMDDTQRIGVRIWLELLDDSSQGSNGAGREPSPDSVTSP